MTPADLSPDSPLTLDEAATVLLRGKVKAYTLRVAAKRGELTVERLGRLTITTPAAVNAWRERCRDQAKERDSISGSQGEQAPPPNGSSETDQTKLALDAAKAAAKALKSGSRNTSRKNTERPAANVHYLKSGLPT